MSPDTVFVIERRRPQLDNCWRAIAGGMGSFGRQQDAMAECKVWQRAAILDWEYRVAEYKRRRVVKVPGAR